MLNRGFSLFEMLLFLSLIAILLSAIVAFYPQFYMAIMGSYLQNRLQMVTGQGLSGLIKDMHRAGFIANSPNLTHKPAIETTTAGTCVIVRYDLTSRGEWRDQPSDPQHNDLFAYRYINDNLEYQTGMSHCLGTITRWNRLFDSNEVTVTQFTVKQFEHYCRIRITVVLKNYPRIQYQTVYYVKNYNQ